MKLKGYIKPYSSFSFTIPIYTEGEHLYYHELNDDLIINRFIQIENNDISLYTTQESFFANKGDYGIIIFIGIQNIPIINFANQIAPQLLKSYKVEILNRSNLMKEISAIHESTASYTIARFKKASRVRMERGRIYTIEEAAKLVKEITFTKFDASVDIDVRLGVDPRKANQMVRGVVSLPHGTGKEVRVLALVTPDKEQEAKDAGADFVGLDDFVEKIKGGWTEVDVIITMPPVMGKVGALGRILGPRGLMPNPKSGTVTMEVGKAIAEVKQGKIDFRVDKFGIVHTSIGKVSYTPEKIKENALEFINTIAKLKPLAAKGTYIKSIYLSSSMSPGIEIGSEVYFNPKQLQETKSKDSKIN